ncbi:[histone H3]-N6,N6-dimethyl-L-lysine4 FAD-dependent demethylase [Geosmithia morbida]|uniref:[histone H3]-N6,N6-dimethyl-L-lysine4 FAD-dependent demethylase n=1 Tax=Geosmithia morbida TaxID=1094350 RepID=A0A9P4YUU6_9HYPO|nr:[histone H3]-N6,N6-dimethyl-L-lysine4 FAD-dependent demethylase [Geosmithia morbida]KAF4123516.1 [histone H3]-N6,N6-dimethyl-L-lysine4 FAD-dependent demethylase [Geosmithia morbida]
MSEISSKGIVVWTEGMHMGNGDDNDDEDGEEDEGEDAGSSDMDISVGEEDTLDHDAPNGHTTNDGAGNSLTSSVLSEVSELPSLSSTNTSKATTPVEADVSRGRVGGEGPQNAYHQPSYRRNVERLALHIQPKSSIPRDIPSQQYASECILAAEMSRLNPYALHPEEYHLFRHHISHAQVTTYLNIRNSILRLWIRQPWEYVTRASAIGCANTRWFDAASVCYDWLVRRGYINFGCVNIPHSADGASNTEGSPRKKQKTIAVIGAGISGLGCARQLEGLCRQHADRFREKGDEPPRVVVIEGRSRVGGRVYSREFKTRPAEADPSFQGKRHTAEMGGMIITGFDRGNPINILVRGQLALPYHALSPDTTIYDTNGRPVDSERDQLIEKLYNDCLDRVSEFKYMPPQSKLIEGNHELMDEGRDSPGDGSKTIMQAEEAMAALPHAPPVSKQSVPEQVSMVPVSSDKLTGRVHTQPGVPATHKASDKARLMGWTVKPGSAAGSDTIDLRPATTADGATLGSVLDYAISQYKQMVDLNAQDHRLINWHIANLEYSNATNLHKLSLPLWDIDAGNEWEGQHTMVVGGYQSVARGLLHCPDSLSLRAQAPVKAIRYNAVDYEGTATIECEDGTVVQADSVVCTIPLGVLKQNTVIFDPPLPPWKAGAVDRLGFGILNKVVLVYDKVFWDSQRHIFGILRDAPNRHSTSQGDYSGSRGRFFQWFNVSNTSGLPCLIALMAGDAGFDTEHSSNDSLVAEATELLRSVFGRDVPYPVETIVTRWGSDRFARGSYSSAAPGMQPDDYDVMARPVGNLYFAGEHTIGSHPATVHGAYLSGLRAASEVLEAMLGPIEVPTPLVLPKDSLLLHKRKKAALDPRQARLDAYEFEVWDHVRSRIGDRPLPPNRPATIAYQIYSREHSDEVRRTCEATRKANKTNKTLSNDVRILMSKMWKEASAEDRRPYEDRAASNKSDYAHAMDRYKRRLEEWDGQAAVLREAYEREHPSVPGPYEVAAARQEGGQQMQSPSQPQQKYRRTRPVSYAEH